MRKNPLLKIGKNYMPAVALLCIMLVMSTDIFAQTGSIGTAIDGARSEIAGIRTNVGNLILAVGGVVGLAGGIRVFVKWQNGDQDVQKHLIGWISACIFLVLSGTIVNAFF